jgi:hypothetical protein
MGHNILADKRKRVAVWPLAAEISWDCGNYQLAALIFLLLNVEILWTF